MEKIDYVEAQTKDWADFTLETMELLNRRAHTLVTMLLGGGGALLAYSLTLLERSAPGWLVAMAASSAVWLLFLSAVGVLRCVRTLPLIPPGNKPGPLLVRDQVLDEMRKERLIDLGGRVKSWAERNVVQADWLDRIYMAAAATPLAAGVAALVTTVVVRSLG